MATKSKFAALTVCFGVLATPVFAEAPKYNASLILSFLDQPVCEITHTKNEKKSTTIGKGRLKHDETTISWSAHCVIPLPDAIDYCTLTGYELADSSTFVSWSTKFENNRIVGKIQSEADINPSFGRYTVYYACF